MLYRLYGAFTVSTQRTTKVSKFSWYKDHRVSPSRKTLVETYIDAREEIKPAWNNVLAVGTIFSPILFKGLTFSTYFDFHFPRAKIVYNIVDIVNIDEIYAGFDSPSQWSDPNAATGSMHIWNIYMRAL